MEAGDGGGLEHRWPSAAYKLYQERMVVALRAGSKQTRKTNMAEMGSAKRVLIYRLGSLGDTLVALPALHLVARAFPDAVRRMLTNFPVNVKAPAAAAILGDSRLVLLVLSLCCGDA